MQVRDSMGHMETVVKERNRAYWLLETGETGERPGGVVKDCVGEFIRVDPLLCI